MHYDDHSRFKGSKLDDEKPESGPTPEPTALEKLIEAQQALALGRQAILQVLDILMRTSLMGGMKSENLPNVISMLHIAATDAENALFRVNKIYFGRGLDTTARYAQDVRKE